MKYSVQARLPQILDVAPSAARITSWMSKARASFDPLEDAIHRTRRVILCPKCRTSIDARKYISKQFFAFNPGLTF
jgi:hypothetical protein